MNKPKNIKTKKQTLILTGCALLLIFISVFFGDVTIKAEDNFVDLTGHAYSSNIGYISFNCASDPYCVGNESVYKVRINGADGQLSGYAWSNNIGRIYFGPDDFALGVNIADAPEDPKVWAQKDSNDNIIGWAKALSADGTNGWDGWIKMNGLALDNTQYGVAYVAGGAGGGGDSFEGKAWGSDIIGWIFFADPVNVASPLYRVETMGSIDPDAPFINLTANGHRDEITVTADGSGSAVVALAWTSANIASCTASCSYMDGDPASCNLWNDVKNISGDEALVLQESMNFDIVCSGNLGTVNDGVAVNVIAPTIPSPPGGLGIQLNVGGVCGATLLSWNDSSNEIKYVVQRKLTGYDFEDIAIIDQNITSYSHSVMSGGEFAYRVASCGDEVCTPAWRSAYSNEITRTFTACSDFSLEASDNLIATAVTDADIIVSGSTVITVTPENLFSGTVSLRVVSVTKGGVDASSGMSFNLGNQKEVPLNVSFASIDVANGVPVSLNFSVNITKSVFQSGKYKITFQGTSPGIIDPRSLTIDMNGEILEPKFIEI